MSFVWSVRATQKATLPLDLDEEYDCISQVGLISRVNLSSVLIGLSAVKVLHL